MSVWGLFVPQNVPKITTVFTPKEHSRPLLFIRAAQSAGFTLDDVRALLDLQAGDAALCQDVQPLIEKRLQDVSQRIKEMRHIQRILKSLLAQCHEQEQDTLCYVVDAFSAESGLRILA